MIHAHPTLKLGRPGISTRDAMPFRTFVDMTKVQEPPFATRMGGPNRFSQWGNASVGDCTCATWACIFMKDAAAHGDSVDFTDGAVLAMYEASGYKPGDASTDNGWSLADAANYAQKIGLVDTGGNVRMSGPWLRINHVDLVEVQIARFMCGALPIGLSLPLAAQNLADIWDTDGSDGKQAPGSWGGHSATLIDYDHNGVVIGTWGVEQFATWRWFQRYCDEAIAKIDPLWVSGDRETPAGFNLADCMSVIGALP